MPLNESVNNSQSDSDFVPRCTHELISGDTCGQPALRGQQVCRFHREIQPRPEFVLPAIEDAASLQLALNRVMRALADDLIPPKKASLLMYGLQIASTNLKRLATEREQQRKKGPEDEPGLLQLLLDKLQIEETQEELAAHFAADMNLSEEERAEFGLGPREAKPQLPHASEPPNVCAQPDASPGSPTGDRGSQTRATHAADAADTCLQPLTPSPTQQDDQASVAPKNSIKVNIKACADPSINQPSTIGKGKLRRVLPRPRRLEFEYNTSTTPSKRAHNKNHPARGPAGWTM